MVTEFKRPEANDDWDDWSLKMTKSSDRAGPFQSPANPKVNTCASLFRCDRVSLLEIEMDKIHVAVGENVTCENVLAFRWGGSPDPSWGSDDAIGASPPYRGRPHPHHPDHNMRITPARESSAHRHV